MYADCNTDFAHVKVCLQRLEDSCFQNVDIDYDMFENNKRETKRVNYLESHSEVFDLNNLFSIRPGFFRVKVIYKYLEGDSVMQASSNWQHFTIVK